MNADYMPCTKKGFLFNNGAYFRFTSPFMANDPFEIWTTFMRYNILSPIPEEIENKERSIFFTPGNDGVNPLGIFGAFCVSSNIENHLMWAHYASNFEGFAIELDKSHQDFETDLEPNRFNLFNKVTYQTSTPKLSEKELDKLEEVQNALSRQEEFNFKDFPFHIFFTKSPYWSYENEYRLLRPLIFADKIITPDYFKDESPKKYDARNIHLYNTSIAAIRSIILGWKVPEDLTKIIYKNLKKYEETQHIKLFITIHPIVQYKICIELYEP